MASRRYFLFNKLNCFALFGILDNKKNFYDVLQLIDMVILIPSICFNCLVVKDELKANEV